jgi:histidine ammonia-lyase
MTAINEVKFPSVVIWPQNMQQIVQDFHCIKGMPQVAGCLDGTLIKIVVAHLNEE